MKIVCLDLEGVLVPEIWIEFSKKTGLKELKVTTREISDYHKLMDFRIKVLKDNGYKLKDIQNVISTIKPLEGAAGFLSSLREKTQVIILSDTFNEFALPLMKQLSYPTIFCNSLKVDNQGTITGISMRQENGKYHSVLALKAMGFKVFSAGDSYNDLEMIHASDAGVLFRAPEKIINQEKNLKAVEGYEIFKQEIFNFLDN
ncbi:MAG: bifunctional phosphoserine phosphatase/homoserine phosphotransferase ThrH [Sphaerochaetaceae bacterium]|nr:bifunctional phosphoserine phosphatase/homoserine phosphotransferase ThrH [Sphaerochaetaceae bacterium]